MFTVAWRLQPLCRALPIAAVLVIAYLPASCAEGEDSSEAASTLYRLTEVARYGWEALSDSTRTLTHLERTYSGGVLADPLDVAEDKNGFVYVIDAGFSKIAVFRPDGSFDRVILGGAGQGPGEFQRPRSITVADDGDLWTYDQIARRITHFRADGTPTNTFQAPVSGMIDILSVDTILYGTRVGQLGQASVVVMDTLGGVLTEMLPLDSTDMRLSGPPSGRVAGMLKDRNGVILAHADAGRWTRIVGTTAASASGGVLFPEFEPAEYEHATAGRETGGEIYVWGGGELSDGRIVIYYVLSSPVGAPLGSHRLAVYEESGEYAGSLAVTSDRGTFAHSLLNPDIFVVQSEPFPQVVRFRIAGLGSEAH